MRGNLTTTATTTPTPPRLIPPYLALVRLLGGPLLLQQQAEVLVGKGGLGVGPGAPVAGGILLQERQRETRMSPRTLLLSSASSAFISSYLTS